MAKKKNSKIEAFPSLPSRDLANSYASHFSSESYVDDNGDIRNRVTTYHPVPAVNQPLVANTPLSFGAPPATQIDTAMAASRAVDALPPTYYEQDNL